MLAKASQRVPYAAAAAGRSGVSHVKVVHKWIPDVR